MLRDSFCKSARPRWLPRERFSESAMTQQWTQIGLIGFRLLFHGRTKKIDAESCICYDSARKAVVFCGKAEAERLKLNEAKSKAPGNRTPLLIKLVLILITNVKIKSRHYSRHQSLEQTLCNKWY